MAPVWGEYVPAAQLEQAEEAPPLNCPAAHVVQDGAPAVLKEPAAQERQAEALVAPAAAPALPAAQGRHAEGDVLPALGL